MIHNKFAVSPGGQKPEICLTDIKSRCCLDWLLLEVLNREVVYIPWLLVAFSILKAGSLLCSVLHGFPFVSSWVSTPLHSPHHFPLNAITFTELLCHCKVLGIPLEGHCPPVTGGVLSCVWSGEVI